MLRFCFLLLIIFLAACGGTPQAAPTQTPIPPLPTVDLATVQKITVVGSTVAAPATDRITAQFRASGYTEEIVNEVTGTGPGISRLCDVGDAQITTAIRAMTDEELTACRQRFGEPLGFTLGLEAVGVFVSQQNTFMTDLTLAELRAIFSTARTWADVRAGWPENPINILAETDSTAFDFFIQTVFADGSQPDLASPNFIFSEDDTAAGRALTTATNPNAITLLGLSGTGSSTLRPVPLEGVALTADTITGGTYPIRRPVWLYTTTNFFQRPSVGAFVTFYLENLPDGLIGSDLALPDAAALQANRQTLQSAGG